MNRQNKSEDKESIDDNTPRCSTGICGRLTFGFGMPDEHGYFDKPNYAAARAYEKAYPEFGECWPLPVGEDKLHSPPYVNNC